MTTPADPFAVLQQAPAKLDLAQTFATYTGHGIEHILTGYDHLLFVTALVLAAPALWDIIKVVSAFTVAHTLTLVLSVLHIVQLESRFVEPMIAASIVFVALQNVFWVGQRTGWRRLVVAFGFGLFHGLGFAGGLIEAMNGLPASGLGTALASFSLGVEIGHQIVVIPVFGLLYWGRKRWGERFGAPALRYGSMLIALGGTYYLYEALEWVR